MARGRIGANDHEFGSGFRGTDLREDFLQEPLQCFNVRQVSEAT